MYNNVHNREFRMKQVTFTEFRRNAATLFDSVERGETVRILRHGKPIAEILPLRAQRFPGSGRARRSCPEPVGAP
jgi:prevent-host-death family protein